VSAAQTAPQHARSAGCGVGAAAGLVPSKTTATHVVSLGANAVGGRRVARLKRAVWASGHLHGLADVGKRPPVVWFVTLTYREADAWAAEHVSRAIKAYRQWCKRGGHACRYTWVAEIQTKRAQRTGDHVVHYHLLAWLPVGVQMPKWDERGWWPHGMSNRAEAYTGVGYLMKYLSKLGELARFPKGLRLYGIGGLDTDGRAVRSWFNLPQWAKAAYGVGDLARASGGLVVRATSEVLAPVWKVLRVPGGLALQKLRDVAPRFGVDQVGLNGYPGAFSAWPRAAS